MEKQEGIIFKQIIERGCGIDVHKQVVVATIRGEAIKEQTQTYSSFTDLKMTYTFNINFNRIN